MFCRQCGKEGSENAVACVGCGVSPLNGTKFCNSCGEASAEKAIVCIKCGCSLDNITNVAANPNPVTSGTAILWYLLCYPVGYSQWGQTTKGWVSLLFLLITFGYGGIVLLVDYIMCYQAQKTRRLGEWDFFPSK